MSLLILLFTYAFPPLELCLHLLLLVAYCASSILWNTAQLLAARKPYVMQSEDEAND